MIFIEGNYYGYKDINQYIYLSYNEGKNNFVLSKGYEDGFWNGMWEYFYTPEELINIKRTNLIDEML